MRSDDTQRIEIDVLDGLEMDTDGRQGRRETAAAGGPGDAAGAWARQDGGPARAGQPFSPFLRWPLDGSPGSVGSFLSMSEKSRRHAAGNDRVKHRSSPDIGFDRYLSRQLHEIYDPILSEAVPDEIAKLLEQFEPRPDGADKTPETE